jgi:hypothetical protein
LLPRLLCLPTPAMRPACGCLHYTCHPQLFAFSENAAWLNKMASSYKEAYPFVSYAY